MVYNYYILIKSEGGTGPDDLAATSQGEGANSHEAMPWLRQMRTRSLSAHGGENFLWHKMRWPTR